MVSDNVMNDPGTSSAPPPPTLEETLRGMMLELQQVRAANEVLHSQMQGLLAQAPAQQQQILPHNVDWRPEPVLSGLKPKPSTFEGKEALLEGWLSSTRDILRECYGYSEEGSGMIRAARI